MSPDNTPDPAGHIIELEAMQKVLEGELDSMAQPKVLLSHTDDLKIPNLANANTNPSENHQDNGAMPPVNTQNSLLHSPP